MYMYMGFETLFSNRAKTTGAEASEYETNNNNHNNNDSDNADHNTTTTNNNNNINNDNHANNDNDNDDDDDNNDDIRQPGRPSCRSPPSTRSTRGPPISYT